MIKSTRRGGCAPKLALFSSATVLAVALAGSAYAQSSEPIKIAVIAEAQAVAGSSIPQAAQLAADEINAAGGVNGRKIEIISYDDHSSAAEAVRAFQRAATENHVNAVIASYISEVVLALEPWTGRLKTVMVTPGAASDVITQNIDNRCRFLYQRCIAGSELAFRQVEIVLQPDPHMATEQHGLCRDWELVQRDSECKPDALGWQ